MDRKVTAAISESCRPAQKVAGKRWILAGTTLALGLCLSGLAVACAPAAAPQSLAGDRAIAAQSLAQADYAIAAATQSAVETQTALEVFERANALEAERQALALQAITITAEAARSNLQLQAEAFTHTLAMSDAQAASAAEQESYSDTLAAQSESAKVIAEGEATRSTISGWVWTAGGLMVIGLSVAILVALLVYTVRWVQSGLRKMHMSELAHAQAMARALPAGDVWIPFDRDPYRTLLRVGGELQPAYEFLGLPAPSPEMLAAAAARRDTIPTHGRGGDGELDREPDLDPAARALLEFLSNCQLMRGAGSDRIPPQRHYVTRWQVSPNTWDQHVASLKPQHLEGQGARGTRIVSRRYKTLGDLVEAVRTGELRPGPARRAPVQADQIEIIPAGD